MEALAEEWRLSNVVFQNWIPTSRLGQFIRSCDVALGVFGKTTKAQRVIPSKVFDICAVGVAFITADTPAVREVFSHGENACLVPAYDPQALADAILELESNHTLKNRIAAGALHTGESTFSLREIGSDLLEIINEKI